MIPLKLQLKNFLSYGSEPQTIDFAPYHLICLSGKNGHGKSALLDAITWALWGQARKTFGNVKADQGLLRLGQTQMFVALDFAFNGQTYRVRREFAKTYGKPHAALDFGLWDPEKNILIPLTDKTIKQTQTKIESLLNLDIESFINTAFLRQGQSNEFSKKSAKDRKNVLATILGLNRYEVIRALALEKVKDAYAQKDMLATLQLKINNELQQKEHILQQIGTVTQNLGTVHGQEELVARDKAMLDQQRSVLQEQIHKQKTITATLNTLVHEETAKHQQMHALRTEWRTTHKKLLNTVDQTNLEMKKRELLNTLNEHQSLLQKNLELKEKILTTKQELHRIEKQLKDTFANRLRAQQLDVERVQLEHKALLHKITEALAVHNQLEKERTSLKHDIIALSKKILDGAAHHIELDAIEKQYEKRKEYYQKFIAQGTFIKQEIESLTRRNTLVHDDDNPSCPLCEQNLSATRKRFLKKHFEQQDAFLQHRIRRLRAVTTQLKELLITQHAHVTTLRKSVDEGKAITTQLEALTKALTKLDAALAHQTTTRAFLEKESEAFLIAITKSQQEHALLAAQEQTFLAADGPLQEITKLLQQQEEALAQTPYDPLKHKDVQQELLVVERLLNESVTRTEQMALQQQRMDQVKTLCTELKNFKKQKNTLNTELTLYKDVPHALTLHTQQEQILVQKLDELRKQKELLLQQKGGLENQHATLQHLEQEYAKQQDMLKTYDCTIADYQCIATATGKDGIQALLIEEAIPEIEQEANQLLGKLTHNQAHIFIESLRDLKSGGTKETLDIKISDSVGIRPYEMFSGGEAFRIDFALRIAISKLLARRAGTSLQTLIIDEGFGSQDEDGLSTIMDALYAIQEDFSKVIIVSHLPTMKDQFPVHFVVEKGPNGSNVRVMEQG